MAPSMRSRRRLRWALAGWSTVARWGCTVGSRDRPVTPANDIYAHTKVIGEQLCELYHRVHGLEVIAFRLGMFVPVDFIHYGMRLVHGGVDERDLAQAFRLALEHDEVQTGTFNLFSPTPFEVEDETRLVTDPRAVLSKHYSGIDALLTAARGHDLEAARWFRVTNEGEVVPESIRVYWKCDRARTVLGWEPRYDFDRFLGDLKDGQAPYVRENTYPVPNAPAPWRP